MRQRTGKGERKVIREGGKESCRRGRGVERVWKETDGGGFCVFHPGCKMGLFADTVIQ